MIRQMIKINEEKCNGCGACATACHEGAIVLRDGKAHVLRDDYCDGLGDCLPVCPMSAITFEQRETLPYDKTAVLQHLAKSPSPKTSGCPGLRAKTIRPSNAAASDGLLSSGSELRQWPVQIKLMPVTADYYNGAHLLIAADCTAYAYAGFHRDFMKNRIAIIGCPKLDSIDYTEKLTEILRANNIKSVTIIRMEVPCCSGLSHAAIEALKTCGKFLPWNIHTISVTGKIIND
jgi:NAD-dependent dihydropyrimidine dehydrogenase PreA subunit